MTPYQRKIAEETRARLVARFPACFCEKGKPKRPLKIGIYQDLRAMIEAGDIPASHLRLAINDFCTGLSYLDCLQAGTPRVDLQGNPVGVVTSKEARHAALQSTGQRAVMALEREHKALRDAALNLCVDENDLPADVPDDAVINVTTKVGAVRALNAALGVGGRGAVQ